MANSIPDILTLSLFEHRMATKDHEEMMKRIFPGLPPEGQVIRPPTANEYLRQHEAVLLHSALTTHMTKQCDQHPHAPAEWDGCAVLVECSGLPRSVGLNREESKCVLIPPASVHDAWTHTLAVEIVKPTSATLYEVSLNLKRTGYKAALLTNGHFTPEQAVHAPTKLEDDVHKHRFLSGGDSVILVPWAADPFLNNKLHGRPETEYLDFSPAHIIPDLWLSVTSSPRPDSIAVEWLLCPGISPTLLDDRGAFASRTSAFFEGVETVASAWRSLIPQSLPPTAEDHSLIGHNED